MISISALDDRYLETSHQSGLQIICIPIGCGSQRFELKSQGFIKLSRKFVHCTQCLKCSRSICDRSIVSDCLEQAFGFVSAAPINSVSVIVQTCLLCSSDRQVDQYPGDLIKSVQIADDDGLLGNLNQFIGELDE